MRMLTCCKMTELCFFFGFLEGVSHSIIVTPPPWFVLLLSNPRVLSANRANFGLFVS